MVLVIEHTPDGAMGVVLNRAADVRVADVVPALADLPDSDQLVRLGGPCRRSPWWHWGTSKERTKRAPPCWVRSGRLIRTPQRVAAPPACLCGLRRLGPGQLDGELEQDAWIIVAAKVDDPFEEGDLWSEAVGRKGGSYRLLSTMPSDPSLNPSSSSTGLRGMGPIQLG